MDEDKRIFLCTIVICATICVLALSTVSYSIHKNHLLMTNGYEQVQGYGTETLLLKKTNAYSLED